LILNSSEYLVMKKLHLQKSNFWGAVQPDFFYVLLFNKNCL